MGEQNTTLEAMPGRSIVINGRHFLYFSGTSYLGISSSEAFRALVREGLEQYGTNYGGSRLGNIRFAVFEEAERWLAAFAGAPAALTMSSGSLAGHILIERLRGKAAFYFAPGTHPALWGEGDYYDGKFEAWAEHLLQQTAESLEPIALFANSVDPLRVQKNSFAWLGRLPDDRPITLVVDDSHGFGVCGAAGSGIWKALNAPDNVTVLVISSLGKALGIPGGMVLGSRAMINTIWHSPFFGGASPPPPAYLYAMLKAAPLYQQAHQKLMANIRRFEQQTGHLEWLRSVAHYPVFYTTVAGLAPWLEAQGCLISQFAYPTPEAPPVTRIVLSALHEKADIDYLAEAILAYQKEKMT